MPSHPERVRRNYHTLEVVATPIASRDILEISLRITRLEIASWTSARLMRDAYAEKIYQLFAEYLPR